MISSPTPIVAIASGKGGVGKTLLATCLATIAQENQTSKKKVLLVDLDFSVKGLTFLFGTAREWKKCSGSMIDIIHRKSPEDVLRNAKTFNGITVLPSDTNFSTKIDWNEYFPDYSDITESFEGLISFALKENFEPIIFDTGAGIERPLLALAKYLEKAIVVVEPDEISLTAALDLRGELSNSIENLYFVVNKEPKDFSKTKHATLEDLNFLPALPFDHKLHVQFVKNARSLVQGGFRKTQYKRYVGRIAKILWNISCQEPTMWDYIFRKKVAKFFMQLLGYGTLFYIFVLFIVLLFLFYS